MTYILKINKFLLLVANSIQIKIPAVRVGLQVSHQTASTLDWKSLSNVNSTVPTSPSDSDSTLSCQFDSKQSSIHATLSKRVIRKAQ